MATKSRQVRQSGFLLLQTRAPTRFAKLQLRKTLLMCQRDILRELPKVLYRKIIVKSAVVNGLSTQIELPVANFLDVLTIRNVIIREISNAQKISAVMAIREPPQILHTIRMEVDAV